MPAATEPACVNDKAAGHKRDNPAEKVVTTATSNVDPVGPTLSIHLGKNLFHCFQATCAAQGNVLDFWAAMHRLPIYDAALHLAETFHAARNREEAPV